MRSLGMQRGVLLDVGSCCAQPLRVISHQPDGHVASTAQDASEGAGRVVVVCRRQTYASAPGHCLRCAADLTRLRGQAQGGPSVHLSSIVQLATPLPCAFTARRVEAHRPVFSAMSCHLVQVDAATDAVGSSRQHETTVHEWSDSDAVIQVGFGIAVSPSVGTWIGERLRAVLHGGEA